MDESLKAKLDTIDDLVSRIMDMPKGADYYRRLFDKVESALPNLTNVERWGVLSLWLRGDLCGKYTILRNRGWFLDHIYIELRTQEKYDKVSGILVSKRWWLYPGHQSGGLYERDLKTGMIIEDLGNHVILSNLSDHVSWW